MRQIHFPRLRPIHSKFMVTTPGCNMRMTARNYIGIHANRSSGALAKTRSFSSKQLKFRGRFHVEQKYSRAQTLRNFLPAFSNAGENDSARRNSRAPQTFQFAAGHNIESASQFRQQTQDS